MELSLPFTGSWKVQNSPARRVPSHGTDLFGIRYAIDFVAVDTDGRTAGSVSWRSVFAAEQPELFFAFGQEVLAPRDGTVRVIHDGEDDHAARRSQLSLIPYLLGQSSRVREGPVAVAGNHVIIEDPRSRCFIALVHLRRGSIRVHPGEQVSSGEILAECGNSGNSTQPHIHLQAMDSLDLHRAHGVPIVFRGFHEQIRSGEAAVIWHGVPANASVVQPVRPARA
ncbi:MULTISPECIES: M23 family metallopeptidase [unclassified Nesterenkonia]|uniref:M23 family metallopeptidase n=1 Tax=unclassified Nesterenkonia TaxID=2629769 RepID=UPI001F4CAECE|nr:MULTISPECIES: M23 family metallopeptidase [unclassified Nesterenkonia]MCH8560416.1 M23 family metallopeptidase [Nesterenkonia sp. DZ6]MCH8570524.1 M23 family metallopeptidase [Nesterenkonia sp. AY15]